MKRRTAKKRLSRYFREGRKFYVKMRGYHMRWTWTPKIQEFVDFLTTSSDTEPSRSEP